MMIFDIGFYLYLMLDVIYDVLYDFVAVELFLVAVS